MYSFLVMGSPEFRKLNVDLPVERVIDDRPWFVAGLLLAVIFLVVVTCAYSRYKGML